MRGTTLRVARIGLCSGMLFVGQIALASVPNAEVVSLLTIIFTLSFGADTFLAVTVFSLLEGCLYGFGLWVISYLYVWPILVALTLLFKKIFKEEFIMWAILSAGFGLIFGALFAIAYLPVDPSYALSYWIAGLPWDVWHAVANGLIMLILGKPLYKVGKRIRREQISK